MKLIKRLKTERTKGGHPCGMGLFQCAYCGSLVKKQLSNGFRNKSCGCRKYIRVIKPKPKPKLKTIKPTRKERIEARQNASLNCLYYQDCLNRAIKGKSMVCYQCKQFKSVKDNYLKEVTHSLFSNKHNQYNEHKIRI